jgi:ubiquinone/menaquinone biosynthesis C-methylase UbiE
VGGVSVAVHGLKRPMNLRRALSPEARAMRMPDAGKPFVGPIPEIYDRCMVPLVFESYAGDLAERLARASPRHVLETAAGTGVLTRALAERLPEDARITATDLSRPMLDRAAAGSPHDRRITWQQADAAALPFEDRRFDAVACQFGVMFFPDKARAFGEARRLLQPGGSFFFNVWDRLAENEFADVTSQALAAFFPADPPQFIARIPHGYFDIAAIRQELRAAGFSSIAVETRDDRSKATSAREAAIAYCQGTPLRHEIEARGASPHDATRVVAEELERRFGSGPIEGRIRAHVVIAQR